MNTLSLMAGGSLCPSGLGFKEGRNSATEYNHVSVKLTEWITVEM